VQRYSYGDRDDLSGGSAVVYAYAGEGDGEVEAAWAAAAGVEVEDAVAGCDGGLVGVAGEDEADACGVGVYVEVVDVVQDMDEAAGEFEGLGSREIRAGAVDVNVAADGGDWGDPGEGGEDVRVADVASVEDVVWCELLERVQEFLSQQGVCVRDGGDEHGFSLATEGSDSW
jgi:hypothetical protein